MRPTGKRAGWNLHPGDPDAAVEEGRVGRHESRPVYRQVLSRFGGPVCGRGSPRRRQIPDVGVWRVQVR